VRSNHDPERNIRGTNWAATRWRRWFISTSEHKSANERWRLPEPCPVSRPGRRRRWRRSSTQSNCRCCPSRHTTLNCKKTKVTGSAPTYSWAVGLLRWRLRSPFHAPHARLAVLNAAARRRASRRHRRGRRRQVARKLVPKTYISIQSVHVPAQPRSGLRTVLLRVLITARRARRSGRISELPGQLIARYRFVVLRAMRCLLDPQ